MATQTKKPPAAKKAAGRFTRSNGGPPPASSLVMVARTKLKVRAGFNPRTKIDEAELDGLAQSILSRGMLTPLLVASTATGYELVAGHRRVAAVDRAIAAGEMAKDVAMPAFLRDSAGELEDAVAENFNRVDLNPLEEAEAFERLRKGGLTAKGIADAVGVAQRRVTERLRILETPKIAWPHFASGALSVQQAKDLADITTFDRRLAELTVRMMVERSGRGIGSSSVASSAAWAAEHSPGKKGELRVLHGRGGKTVHVSVDALGALPQGMGEKLVLLRKDADAVRGYTDGRPWQVPLDTAAIDTLRANGVLLEVKDTWGDRTLICKDLAALRAVAEPIIEKAHGDALKREANRQRAKQDGGKQAAAKEDEKAREYAVTVAARDYNLRLGTALIRNYSTVDLTAEVIRFLALAPSMTASTGYYDNASIRAELFQRGLRYIDQRYQDEKLIKSTGRTKVSYWSIKSGSNDCVAAFTTWWELAATPQEIAGRTIIAWAAATYARQETVSRAQQAYGPSLREDALAALEVIVAKKLPKWESPDPAERAREQAHGLSDLQAEVLAVIAADQHTIGATEATMLESIVEKIPDDLQDQPRSKTAVRDAIRTMKDAKLLDGVLAGGIGITPAGVEVAKALHCEIGPRAAKKATATDDEKGGSADEADPDPADGRRVMVAPASDVPNGQAKLARLMADQHPSNPTGLRKVIYVDSKTAAWVAAERILAEKPASRDPAKASAAASSAKPAPERHRRTICLGHIRGRPGITIPEIAEAMGVKQNYLYRLLPGLEQDGHVRKEGRGWFPVGADPERAKSTELGGIEPEVLQALVDGATATKTRSLTQVISAQITWPPSNGLTATAKLQAIVVALDRLTKLGLVANGEKAPYATKQGGEVAAALETKAAA